MSFRTLCQLTQMSRMTTLGQLIRNSREAMDLSLREFAKRISIAAAFLSDIELGKRNPSSEVLTRIADALGLAVEELQKLDSRAPLEDLKRLTRENPLYGYAFRRAIASQLRPEDLINLAEEKTPKSRRRK